MFVESGGKGVGKKDTKVEGRYRVGEAWREGENEQQRDEYAQGTLFGNVIMKPISLGVFSLLTLL